MKYLVTGGLGFIGSNMTDLLIAEGHDVIVVDDLSTGDPSYKNPKAEYVHAHITDLDTMQGLSQNVDAIFHFAAWARLQRSINDPIGTNNANVNGTVTLLEAARRNKIQRFIFSSSSSVYGEQAVPKMEETMAPNPLHPYALQKWVGEEYCKLYSKLFGIQTVRLRYFNVYGPRQILQGDYALVLGKFLQQKAKGERLTIYGVGAQTRSYTHVSDVVRANLLVATKLLLTEGESQVFNVGTDVETSVRRIAELVLGSPIQPVDDRVQCMTNPRGKFEEQRKCASYARIQQAVGWSPQVSVEEGVKMLCQ